MRDIEAHRTANKGYIEEGPTETPEAERNRGGP
jgi:hypothetical protein